MATHRIHGEFTVEMAEMDGTPEQSAEILQDLMYERFGYLKYFSVYIDPKNCAVEEED